MTPARVGCVVNPVSGDGRGREHLATIRETFPQASVAATVTGSAAEVPRAAREHQDADLLVAVGGDGTLGEVAGALVGADGPPLFVVPAGRGNSAYRHFYGDADWEDLVRKLADGLVARPADLGEIRADPPVERRYFVLGFTAGLFRRALDAADSLRVLPGPLAYLVGTARAAVADPPLPVSVAVDGDRRFDGDVRLVAVGGGRYRGNAFELLPGSRRADGALHVLVVEPTGGREWLRLARLARDGRHLDHPAVHSWTGERVDLDSPDGLPVEADGTPLASVETARLDLRPGALTLAYPERGR